MKQNVLFFIFRLYGGGAERIVSNLSQAWSSKYNVKIAVYDLEERTYPYGGELIRIKLPFAENVAKNGKIARLVRLLTLVVKLRRLKKQYAIHSCISFAEQANIINILSGRSRTIISVRTTLTEEMKSAPRMRVLQSLIRILYNRAYRVITPSSGIAADLVQHFGVHSGKVLVIPNYLDRERIDRLCHEPLKDPSLIGLFRYDVLLHVGRITPAKGLWLAFHVFKVLKQDYPQLKLVSVGEGESEASFKKEIVEYAKTIGLKVADLEAGEAVQFDADVFFLGFQSNPFQMMRNSKLLIFPSVFEGFPNTILESLECRLPVVAADCNTGPAMILQPDQAIEGKRTRFALAKYGVLAPALTSTALNATIAQEVIDEWTKAVQCLLGDDTLRTRYIHSGTERVNAFDKKVILDQWEKLVSGD